MAGQEVLFDRSREILVSSFGPIDAESERFDFGLTDYYARFMGPGLKRMFVSFARLVPPDRLSAFKIQTNALEAMVEPEAGEFDRSVNLDPGYVTRAALIMATAKDFSHRIPLQDGIYAHLELLFEKGGIRCLPWTYPDFRDGRYTGFFLKVRGIYMEQADRL